MVQIIIIKIILIQNIFIIINNIYSYYDLYHIFFTEIEKMILKNNYIVFNCKNIFKNSNRIFGILDILYNL